MTIQETAIAKLRQLPDPLAHLVNEFIDVLLNQWAKLSSQSPTLEPQSPPQVISPASSPTDFPSLKQVGSFWVAKATHQTDINWNTLVQDDRENRIQAILDAQ